MTPSLLVVDDDAFIRQLVEATLADDDVHLSFASTGWSGLERALTAAPDLVLLDIDMPFMDGFEVCKLIRSDLRSRRTEVVFLSASSKTEDKVRGLELGASDYVTKPFDADELRARLHRVLKAKAASDATRSRRVDDFIARALA
jgi:DNA-binding response OmpR family regulator